MGRLAEMLAGAEPARKLPWTEEQRGETRRTDLIARGMLFFRGSAYPVAVHDIATRGAMIAAELDPRIGESVIVQFEGCTPIYASVRWTKEGRIGLKFGEELTLA